MNAEYPQVGRGWAFPSLGEVDTLMWGSDGTLLMSDGAEHVEEALVILLRTATGSRVMRPDLGAGVDWYVFEPRTAEACYRLADDVRRALMLGEPRIIVDRVEAVASPSVEDRVDVTIEYRIDRHRRPQSLVVPFYLAGSG
jgi:phage baseplate assembly protein W